MAKNIYVQSVFLLFILPHILAENYDFLQKCDINDPNIDDCMLRSANLALPHLLKGLIPWEFPKYTYGSNEKFSVSTENAVVHGFEELKVTNIKWNMEQRHITVQFSIPILHAISNYIAEGHFMDHKLSGKGLMLQVFDKNQAQLEVDYEVNGHGYATVTDVKFDKKIEKLTFYFQGLYNGEETNSLINKNSETFYAIFAPMKKKVFAHAARQIFSSVFRTNTIDSLFVSKSLNGIKNEL